MTRRSVIGAAGLWPMVPTALQRATTTLQLRGGVVRPMELMAYGAYLLDNWRRPPVFVDKTLKGARPADLPVQQPTKFNWVINLKAAQAPGLTIPQPVRLRADEVIG